MDYNFDQVIDRTQTNDMKWHPEAVAAHLPNLAVDDSMIPMWIADMDFAAPPSVVEALVKRAQHGIYGYCAPRKPYFDSIVWWFATRHHWKIEPEWIALVPGIVPAINIAIRAFSEPGDQVIIQHPVYEPFDKMVKGTGRVMVNNGLVEQDDGYHMDLVQLEELASQTKTKILVLCSPHNPVGRVWSKEELVAVGEICLRHNVIVISDEIHCDITYSGHTHTPFLAADPRFIKNSIVCTAPSKTFNIAGLKVSNIIIPDPAMKKAFCQTQDEMHLVARNTFGLEAMDAAYSPAGADWLDALLKYLDGNMDVVEDFVREKLPKVKLHRPEGTFLCWLDFSAYGYTDNDLLRRIDIQAQVVCVPGPWFGSGGEQYMRLNVGCTRANLTLSMERIAKALM